jgi:hypothetical protein
MQLNDPFDEGQISTHTATKRGKRMSTLKYRKLPSFTANIAELEALDAILTPFRLIVEELDEMVDRFERDGVCSAEGVEKAREEIVGIVLDLNFLVIRKVELHERLRAVERASK